MNRDMFCEGCTCTELCEEAMEQLIDKLIETHREALDELAKDD